jgi:GntR family transcriptional regulator
MATENVYIRIEPGSGVPIYRQILDQIKTQAAGGSLRPGDQLPSVRDLARQLAVNQNTILKVYDRLRQEGAIDVKRGNGTFIAATSKSVAKRHQKDLLIRMIDDLLTQAQHFGWDLQEIQAILADRSASLQAAREESEGIGE